ncbi:MAG TPA: SDR family oxidoreductase [Gemmatimonadaceae bacterium]|jgi:NAD(P)-dependent dehydrogenase (short-subunit alcohol dehydrogenase family)
MPPTRVAVITGIGKPGQAGEVIARTLAERGARIVAVGRTRDEVDARVADLHAAGHEALGFACDLTDEVQVAQLASDVTSTVGTRVDTLVNVAGGFAMSGPVGESTLATWHTQFAINATTAYLATRAFLPSLRAANGAIVYFAAAAVLPGAKLIAMSAYGAAKSAVVALMRAVAEEERANGVRANAIAPTAIRTAANMASMGDKVRYVEREDVATIVAWLCSDAARAITGQLIRLG